MYYIRVVVVVTLGKFQEELRIFDARMLPFSTEGRFCMVGSLPSDITVISRLR